MTAKIKPSMEDNRPTIIDFVEKYTHRFGDHVYLREKVDGKWLAITQDQTRREAHRIGAGLMSLGVEKGEKIALLSESRAMWVLAELGVLYAGAVDVPLSVNLGEGRELQFRIAHSEAHWVMVSGNQLPRIRAIIGQCPAVKKVIVFDDTAFHFDTLEENELRMSDVQRAGDVFLKEHRDLFETRFQSVGPDDYANINYTSGTTTNPKGVLLTHRNYTANVLQSNHSIAFQEKDVMLLILPLDHCFAHVAGMYKIMCYGGSLAFVPIGKNALATLKNIPAAISEVRPHLMLCVPSLARNFKRNIESGIKSRGPRAERVFNAAVRNAEAYNKEYFNRGGFRSLWRRPLMALYDRKIFSKVRERFDPRLRFIVSGGAMLDIELQRFFYAIGIPVYQGYGLTEATPIISSNSPGHTIFGSSGRIVRPMDCKICDGQGKEVPHGTPGEIVVRGENVMAGYWKNPEETAKTVVDGWLHTGDRGYICPSDPDYLFVVGRFKSLLISSDGEKCSPESFENSLPDTSKYVSQVVLHNDQDPYTVALVVPDREALSAYVKELGKDPSSGDGKVAMLTKLQSEIDAYRKGGPHYGLFPERWLPAAVVICDEPFTLENKMMNSTMKIVRGQVEKHYASRIAYAYTPEGKQLLNELNIASV